MLNLLKSSYKLLMDWNKEMKRWKKCTKYVDLYPLSKTKELSATTILGVSL